VETLRNLDMRRIGFRMVLVVSEGLKDILHLVRVTAVCIALAARRLDRWTISHICRMEGDKASSSILFEEMLNICLLSIICIFSSLKARDLFLYHSLAAVNLPLVVTNFILLAKQILFPVSFSDEDIRTTS